MHRTRVQVYRSAEALAEAAAELLLTSAVAAAAARGRVLLVLAGGSTPSPVYRLLVQEPYASRMPWKSSHFFWGDERAVPSDHPQSNYGSFYQMLISSPVGRLDNLHRIEGDLPLYEAAANYSELLESFSDAAGEGPLFDTVLLGLGADGHTASIFPGTSLESMESSLVAVVSSEYKGRPSGRITLTPRSLNQARQILFLVTGAEKADAVRAALEEESDPLSHPSHRITAAHGNVYWLIDEDAASMLSRGTTV